MISYKHGSLFPIFPFSGFMLSGVAFGAWLQSLHQEKDQFSLINMYFFCQL